MAQMTALALIAAKAFDAFATSNAQSHRASALRQQAETQRALAKAEEQKLRRRQSRNLSALSAQLAARGLDPSAGSALLLQENSAAESEFDALLARAGALSRVNELEVGAQQADLAASATLRRGLLDTVSGARSEFGKPSPKPKPKIPVRTYLA